MNVGQVEFSVSSKTLESVLASARELNDILNGIDGRTYGGKGGTGRNIVSKRLKTHQKAMRMVANDEKKYATQQHEREVKAEKKRFNAKRKALKLGADIEARYAKQKHMTDLRQQQQERKERKKSFLEQAKLEYHLRQGRHKAEKEAQKKEEQHQKDIEKSKRDLLNDVQETERKYAIQQHFQKKKDQKDELKAEEDALNQQIRARAEFQKGVQQQLVNTGAQMQTLGATLQRITSPFADIYRGMLYGVGYRALGMVTQSISGAFSRYDTIQTYSKVLTNLGVDATKKFSIAGQEATDVYHNLENAVLGLPTGIDEIIESMRRYAGATGEAERATKLAIAANNAYIAGHMGEREKLFTERQLVALAGGAELSTNQWDSLRRNAPLAMKVVAQQMKMSVQDMVDSLKKGEISGQRFLDVFISAGTEGKIKDAAQVMKQTWDAVAQNVQNRLNAMGEGILKTLDEVFTSLDGRNFLQHVLGVDKKGNYIGGGLRGLIDDMSKSAQEWIRNNPNKILDFFETLQKIDWKGIVSGFAEMGLYLGKFYAFGAKIAGNAGFIKFMINLNMFGKVIQTAGGLLKGLATPISWIITMLRFGSVAEGGGKVGQLIGGLTDVGKKTEAMALTWQGVASKAVVIAAIPAIAWSLKEVALAFQEFDKVDLSWGLVGKIQVAALALAEFTGLATVMGSLLAGGHIGFLTTAGAAIGTTEIAAISKTMKWLGEGLNAIANANIPSISRITRVMDVVKQIERQFKSQNIFESIGKIFVSWKKSAEFKAVKDVGSAFDSLVNVASFKMPSHWKDKVTKRLGAVKDILDDFEDMFIDFETERQKTTTSRTPVKGKFGKQTKNATPKVAEMQTRFKQFAESMESVGKAFTSIVDVVQAATKIDKVMNKAMSKIPIGSNGEKVRGIFTTAKSYLKQITDGLYEFLGTEGQDGQTMMQNLQQVSSSFYAIDITNIAKQLNQIPKIFNVLSKINNELIAEGRNGRSASSSRSIRGVASGLIPIFKEITKLQKIIPTDLPGFENLTAINTGIARIKRTIVKLRELSAMGSNMPDLASIRAIAETIKEALQELENIGAKKVNVELEANITGQKQVKKDVKKEIEKLKRQIENMDATVVKDIHVNLTSRVTGISAAIAGARAGIKSAMDVIRGMNSTVNKTITVNTNPGGHAVHTGGRIGKKVQYRAHGGSIFQPRGTDVIPAMLTEGEYVVNHMAANAIGYDVLQKLNHLDIAGAIKGLYARASTSTINNTKNANVTVNNYNAPSVGFAKASRWVQQL